MICGQVRIPLPRRLGEKLPKSIRTAPVKFEEIPQSAKEHVEKHNAKPQTVLHRINEWIKAFGAKPEQLRQGSFSGRRHDWSFCPPFSVDIL
jgi:hypothetical protein